MRFLRFGRGGQTVGRSDFAEQRLDLILSEQLGHDRRDFARLALFVLDDELNLATVDATGVVDLVARHLNASSS